MAEQLINKTNYRRIDFDDLKRQIDLKARGNDIHGMYSTYSIIHAWVMIIDMENNRLKKSKRYKLAMPVMNKSALALAEKGVYIRFRSCHS